MKSRIQVTAIVLAALFLGACGVTVLRSGISKK